MARCAAVLLLLMSDISPAMAEASWVPVLEPLSSRDFQQPSDGYQIRIPPDQRQGLALELDGIDVTSLLRWDGEYARFTPTQPLAFGTHRFRLLRFAADGTPAELGRWAIEVRSSRRFREISGAADITITGYQRLAKNLSGSAEAGTGAQGGANLKARLANGRWAIDGTANVFVDTTRQSTSNESWIDLGQYLISGTASNDQAIASLYVGDRAEDFNSLILQDFNRRGLAGSARINALHAQVTAFSKRTDAITGAQDFFGLSDPDRRVDGVVARFQPLADHPAALDLSGAYITGKGKADGQGIGTVGEEASGDAWSGGIDSRLFGKQLHLYGEYAVSRFDFDGRGSLDKVTDHAWRVGADFAPAPRAGRSYDWDIGVQNQRVGTFFTSLADPSLPSDQNITQVQGNLHWRALSLQASAARLNDNLEDESDIARVVSYDYDLSLDYAPDPELGPDGRITGWLGTPDYTLQLHRTRNDEKNRHASVAADPTNNRTRQATLGANFNYTRASWGLSYTYSDFEDMTGLTADTTTQSAILSASLPFFEDHLIVAPSAQFQTTLDSDNHVRLNETVLSLESTAALIANRLSGGLTLSMDRTRQTDETIDCRVWSMDATLAYTLLAARRNRPGFDLGVNGSLQITDDNVVNVTNDGQYQVFLTLKVTAPLVY